ncbi:uncharacterized protein N7477_004934 [Penicillium maclennaniae]|uniref:uncharacterized protein n=1 Tax=Penicillium maclennaniae TaxID=1343394 RepID=UPI0025404C31|nr:uncharacterized protein N7477_004934 [Penicillium maclennaniae]KAJ5675000.1 hypothetical protein N7477_004934 [Penicillium maclennaniae]
MGLIFQREETVTLIHPWLKDAEKVAWAYKLRTADGTSKMSGWSDEFAVPDTGAVSLPVFRLDNFGFRIATERVVYHKKLVRGTTKWVGDGSEGNDLVEARVIKEDIFVDCMPDL